jgi:hypothetical protein
LSLLLYLLDQKKRYVRKIVLKTRIAQIFRFIHQTLRWVPAHIYFSGRQTIRIPIRMKRTRKIHFAVSDEMDDNQVKSSIGLPAV